MPKIEKEVIEQEKLSNRLIIKKGVKNESLKPVTPDAGPPKLSIAYATGRRKESVARVWVSIGSGKFMVNKRSRESYFHSATQAFYAIQPFITIDAMKKYDVKCTVKGGGVSGQAGAVRLGIARALCLLDSGYRIPLKKEQLLKRNSKVVERKKYGHHKARKRPQFSKR